MGLVSVNDIVYYFLTLRYLLTPHNLAHSRRLGFLYVTPSVPHTGLYSGVAGHLAKHACKSTAGVVGVGGEVVDDPPFVVHRDDFANCTSIRKSLMTL